MDKRLFELQVRHNYFMRFTVVSICKILLVTFFFGLFLGFMAFAQGVGISWAVSSTYKPAVYVDKVNGFVVCLILIASVLYAVFWVSTIRKIISQHKVVTYLEKGFYKNVDKGYYESEVFHDTYAPARKDKHTDKDIDKMIDEEL